MRVCDEVVGALPGNKSAISGAAGAQGAGMRACRARRAFLLPLYTLPFPSVRAPVRGHAVQRVGHAAADPHALTTRRAHAHGSAHPLPAPDHIAFEQQVKQEWQAWRDGLAGQAEGAHA